MAGRYADANSGDLSPLPNDVALRARIHNYNPDGRSGRISSIRSIDSYYDFIRRIKDEQQSHAAMQGGELLAWEEAQAQIEARKAELKQRRDAVAEARDLAWEEKQLKEIKALKAAQNWAKSELEQRVEAEKDAKKQELLRIQLEKVEQQVHRVELDALRKGHIEQAVRDRNYAEAEAAQQRKQEEEQKKEEANVKEAARLERLEAERKSQLEQKKAKEALEQKRNEAADALLLQQSEAEKSQWAEWKQKEEERKAVESKKQQERAATIAQKPMRSVFAHLRTSPVLTPTQEAEQRRQREASDMKRAEAEKLRLEQRKEKELEKVTQLKSNRLSDSQFVRLFG